MVWWRSIAIGLALSISLTGCGDSTAEQRWQVYHQQLASDLAQPDINRTAPGNIGDFPERSERLIDVPETRDSLLNVYALRECQITSLVAARNNQLGRVAPPSQQWLYERTLWQRLSTCLNSDVAGRLSAEDQARLHQLTSTKTAQLPAVSWNAIFDSSEWIKSFSRASQPLSNVEDIDMESQLGAINYLHQMTVHQFDIHWQQDSATLENHLKTLQTRPLTAEVLRALILATQRLTEANTLLVENSHTQRCLSQLTPSWLEHLANTGKQWLTAVNRLIDAQPVDHPVAVQRYQSHWLSLNNTDAPWVQFQQARQKHEALRARFPVCLEN